MTIDDEILILAKTLAFLIDYDCWYVTDKPKREMREAERLKTMTDEQKKARKDELTFWVICYSPFSSIKPLIYDTPPSCYHEEARYRRYRKFIGLLKKGEKK